MRRKKIWKKSIMYICLITLAIASFFPFYVMIINATRGTSDILAGFSMIPGNNIINNFHEMQSRVDVLGAFRNSLIIASLSTLLTCYFSAMTAYGLTVYNFKYKNKIFTAILIIMMIPPQLSIIGFFKFMKGLNLLNSFVPLILPSISSAATVFFMKQYAETALSQSIVESSRIDGAGEFMIFNKMALPILAPAIFTMGINSFVASWNNYLVPLIMLSETKKFTMPLVIRIFNADTQDPSIGAMYLCIAISIVPIMVVFFMFSRYIIEGIGAGGEKE